MTLTRAAGLQYGHHQRRVQVWGFGVLPGGERVDCLLWGTDCISIHEAYGRVLKGKYQEGGKPNVNRLSAPWQPDLLVTAVGTVGGSGGGR